VEKKEAAQLLISDIKGRIYPDTRLEAAGMKGGRFFRLGRDELIKLPPASRLFFMPDRVPVAYDSTKGCFTALKVNPFSRKITKCFPVAAFTPPGFTVTYNSSYKEVGNPKMLPLFAYAACAFYKGEFYVAAIKVDSDRRHDSRFINIREVRKNVVSFRRVFAHNRLVRHLERCALNYGCPNAQNFFLSRYEAPLPSSPVCNARCAGCISYQAPKRCAATQPRIEFIPTAEEIRDIAVFHILKTKDPIVSFGQGCEGEPLLSGDIVEQAIRLIRRETQKGIININTNASKPKVVSRLFDAGINTMRVSMNSVRREYYTRYYKPKGYSFKDVIESIAVAHSKGGFVSINYLTMPGFTDSKEEFAALNVFLGRYKIDMLQWRNLNIDPLRYFAELKAAVPKNRMLGLRQIMWALKKNFPNLMMGYFNPSRKAH